MTLHYTLVQTPFGWMGVLGGPSGLCRVVLPRSSAESARAELLQGTLDIQEDDTRFAGLIDRLQLYFAGEPVAFPDPLDWTQATPFQQAVYTAVRAVPYGTTASYAEIARGVGQPKAARAVGYAMAINPWPIVVPCHRIIGSDGRLCGYGGGLAMKQALLALERSGGRREQRTALIPLISGRR